MRLLAAAERSVDGLDVLLGQHLEQELVARPPGRVPGAGFTGAQHREADRRHVQQLGDRPGGLAGLVLERPGAADPEQVFVIVIDHLGDHGHLELQALRPVHPAGLVLPPRVALVLQIAEQPAQLRRELGFDHHLVAAHVHDVVDVLDIDRALLHTGAAGGAIPQHLGVDDPVDLGPADQRPPGLQHGQRIGVGQRL